MLIIVVGGRKNFSYYFDQYFNAKLKVYKKGAMYFFLGTLQFIKKNIFSFGKKSELEIQNPIMRIILCLYLSQHAFSIVFYCVIYLPSSNTTLRIKHCLCYLQDSKLLSQGLWSWLQISPEMAFFLNPVLWYISTISCYVCQNFGL